MRRFNLILPIGLSLVVHMGVFVLAAAYYGAGPLGGGGGGGVGGGGGGGGYPSSVTVSIVSLSGPGPGGDGREAAKTNIPARGIKKSLARKAVKTPQDKGKKVRREKLAGSRMEKPPIFEDKKVIKGPPPPVIEDGEISLTRREKEKPVTAAVAEFSKRDIKGQETGEAQESPLEHGLDINSKPPPPAPDAAAPVIVSPVFVSTGGGIDGAQDEGEPGGAGGPGLHLPEGGSGGPSAGTGRGSGSGMGMGSENSIEIIGLNTPRYPRYSRIRGEEGTVIIEIDLKGDGSPGRVVVARSSGYARLDHAALKAAREAEFVIPGGDKRRVMISKRIAFTFKLKDGDARQ